MCAHAHVNSCKLDHLQFHIKLKKFTGKKARFVRSH